MDTKSLWYLEDVNLTNIFCPIKLEDGALDNMTKKSIKKERIFTFPKN